MVWCGVAWAVTPVSPARLQPHGLCCALGLAGWAVSPYGVWWRFGDVLDMG